MKRSRSQTILDHVYVITSGLFTLPPFEVALAVFGIDRVLFSIDILTAATGRVGNSSMQLNCPYDLEKVAHGNADRLLKLKS